MSRFPSACMATLCAAVSLAAAACSSAGSGASAADAGRSAERDGASGSDAGNAPEASTVPKLEGNFSFFVTSVEAMRELSGSADGFGGNLGGLSGADGICQTIAKGQGAGYKTWRAFLSATAGGPSGGPVHAIDRIGEGPWYDRVGRLVASDRAGLLAGDRPLSDVAIVNTLPNERGELLGQNDADDHDVMTGSNAQGQLLDPDPTRTCMDWTSTDTTADLPPVMLGSFVFSIRGPMCGHAWPAISGQGWIQSHPAPGCAAGVTLAQAGPPAADSLTVGGGGGYGAIYCFATTP